MNQNKINFAVSDIAKVLCVYHDIVSLIWINTFASARG